MTEHYFLERFLSVAIYAILSIGLMGILRYGKVRVKTALRVYTILLTLLAWFFIPASTMDLYRLWITASDYSGMSFFDMAVRLMNSAWSSPFSIFYVSALSKISPHLLPALTVFLFYTNITYIVEDYYKRHDIRRNVVAVVFFLFLSRGIYSEVMSGIRCMLAFSFVARCIYNEIYNKKKFLLNTPFYLFAALMHSAAIAAIGIWMIIKVFTSETGKKRVIYLITICLVGGLFYYRFGNLVTNTIAAAEGYISDTESYFYIWEYLFNGLYLIFVLYIAVIKVKRLNKGLSPEGRIARKTVLLYAAICIVFITTYSIFHRFISLITMFSIPLLMEIISEYSEQKESKVIINNILAIAILFLFLSGLKGNLNGIRFFTL